MAATSAPSAAGLEICRAPAQATPTAVDDEGDAALLEARAEQRAIALAKRMIEDGARQSVVLHEEEGVLECVGRGQLRRRSLRTLE